MPMRGRRLQTRSRVIARLSFFDMLAKAMSCEAFRDSPGNTFPIFTSVIGEHLQYSVN